MGVKMWRESLPCCYRAGSIQSSDLLCHRCGGLYDENFNYIGKGNMKPISPKQAKNQKIVLIPDEVIESFNEMIVENLQGQYSCFRQEDVEKRIREKFKNKQFHMYNWPDIRNLYIDIGWEVEYDAPGYDENFPATFSFKAKN